MSVVLLGKWWPERKAMLPHFACVGFGLVAPACRPHDMNSTTRLVICPSSGPRHISIGIDGRIRIVATDTNAHFKFFLPQKLFFEEGEEVVF